MNIQPKNLQFVDALWRKFSAPNFIRRALGAVLPEFIHIYPIYRINVIGGKISKHDEEMILEIAGELKKIISGLNKYYIFCPLGIGGHVDHAITREVCLKNFKNVILWSDFPYSLNEDVTNVRIIKKELFRWSDYMEQKKNMISAYRSQIKGLFPDGDIKLAPEIYYEKR